MKLSLSPRLRECCRYIRSGERIADVGCDHGYLSIYLLKSQIASFALAADINEGPLNSARQNADRFQVAQQMEFFLSDGLQNVPRDFDCLICAGMGAETMISILKNAAWLHNSHYHLVLQCQTKTHLLREYLYDAGWVIQEESIVRDSHFLYTVMDVKWQPGTILTPGQYYISPALMKNPGEELQEYYSRIVEGLRQAVVGRGENASPELIHAYTELCNDPSFSCLRR